MIIGSLLGLAVYVEEPQPRYVLPDDVPPPLGMTRQDFDAWSRRVCGYHETISRDGEALKTPTALHMNLATYHQLRTAIAAHEKKRGGA